MAHFKNAGTDKNGWMFTTKTGLYGTDYLQRALITAIGLGANRPQDAVYPTSEDGCDGKPYDGANKYVMHFPKGQMPPANGFWSLTMYNARLLLRRQSAQPLHAQLAEQTQDQRRRLGRSLHPEETRRGQTRSRIGCRRPRAFHSDAAAVLAEGEGPVDSRRHVDAAGCEAGQLDQPRPAAVRTCGSRRGLRERGKNDLRGREKRRSRERLTCARSVGCRLGCRSSRVFQRPAPKQKAAAGHRGHASELRETPDQEVERTPRDRCVRRCPPFRAPRS